MTTCEVGSTSNAQEMDQFDENCESKPMESKATEEEAESDVDYGEEDHHEFEIIDQVESEEEEDRDGVATLDQDRDSQGKPHHSLGDGANADPCSDTSEEDDDDMDDSEIHAMLEKGINSNSIKKREVPADGKPVIKYKTVLKEIDTDPFDILPEGWIFVTHYCGMPVYLHKESRVCTMARPYSLGSASARTHSIPISAIPCLMYRKQLDKMAEKEMETVQSKESPVVIEAEDSSVPGNKFVCQATQDTLSNGGLADPSTSCPFGPGVNSSASASQEIGQRPVLVAEESSCLGQVHQTTKPKEALHTGINEFSVINQESAALENIAVEKTVRESKEVVTNGKVGTVCPHMAVDGNGALDISECHQSSLSVPPLPENCFSGVSESGTNEVPTCPETSKYVPEEGEIVEDDSTSERDVGLSNLNNAPKAQQETCAPPASTVSVPDLNMQAQTVNNQQHLKVNAEVDSDTQPLQNGNKNKSESHVVREEEGSGNPDKSELVTSNTNSLANLKRKIESLRNKHGGKLRRVDTGRGASSSAVGWPVENNVASPNLQYDSQNPEVVANSQETLKANAAAIKIKCAEDRARESLLDSKAVQSYCSKLFQFKVIEVKKYSSWKERRKYLEKKHRRNRPELPTATKLITCPMPGSKPDPHGAGPVKREFILNPTGKSYLCILHEYMQRTLKIQPVYVFKELENSKTPYGATVTINNIEYGAGYASSKKVAKQEAAKETLKILMPDLFNKMSDQDMKHSISDLSFFDNVKVTDSRILDLGNKVGQPSPFEILQECLRRNFGLGNTKCEITTKPLKNQRCEYSITVGKHVANVIARNKRDGKQQASQAILAKLHPHVPSWGSLLRLYGTSVEKPIQKPERMSEFKSHAPNHAVLESLREEMKKLHQQKEAIQVKGKIIISSRDLPSKTFGVDL